MRNGYSNLMKGISEYPKLILSDDANNISVNNWHRKNTVYTVFFTIRIINFNEHYSLPLEVVHFNYVFCYKYKELSFVNYDVNFS